MFSSITTSKTAQTFSGLLVGQNNDPNEIYVQCKDTRTSESPPVTTRAQITHVDQRLLAGTLERVVKELLYLSTLLRQRLLMVRRSALRFRCVRQERPSGVHRPSGLSEPAPHGCDRIGLVRIGREEENTVRGLDQAA